MPRSGNIDALNDWADRHKKRKTPGYGIMPVKPGQPGAPKPPRSKKTTPLKPLKPVGKKPGGRKTIMPVPPKKRG